MVLHASSASASSFQNFPRFDTIYLVNVSFQQTGGPILRSFLGLLALFGKLMRIMFPIIR